MTNEDSYIATIEKCNELFGGLDILVLNAGVAGEYRLIDVTDAQYHNEFDVNVKGVLYGLRHGAKSIRPGGNIIVTSSISSTWSNQEAAIYCASKAAATSLVKSAAIEFASLGIRVNAVSPGPVKTTMAFPESFGEKLTIRKTQGMPEELAGAYLLLASDAGKNINGADFVVDGGMTAGFTEQTWNWVFGTE